MELTCKVICPFPLLFTRSKNKTLGAYNVLLTTLDFAELHSLEQETVILPKRQRWILISIIQIAAVIFTRFWEHRTHFSSVPSPKAINTTFFSQAEKNHPMILLPTQTLLQSFAKTKYNLAIAAHSSYSLATDGNDSKLLQDMNLCDIPFRQGAFSQFPLLHWTEVNC